MNRIRGPKPNPWLFFLGDILLLGLAVVIVYRSGVPLGAWPAFLSFLCVSAGAWMAVLPFLLEHRAAVRLMETEQLIGAVTQIRNLEKIQEQIQCATTQWQSIQDQAARGVHAAKEIVDRMTAETKEFFNFLEKADQTEKAHLRLETEKLRRAEGEWLQVVVHILDHIFALNQAARRSGQPALISQLDQFQHACRDAARRMGLVSYTPQPDEKYEPKLHQTQDGNSDPLEEALVNETIANGFTFQGKLLRRAMVVLRSSNDAPKTSESKEESAAPDPEKSRPSQNAPPRSGQEPSSPQEELSL